jgi:hypothetical protein
VPRSSGGIPSGHGRVVVLRGRIHHLVTEERAALFPPKDILQRVAAGGLMDP